MAVFCVSYDLNKQGQNYEVLYAELRKTEYYHILGSTWLVSTSENVSQLQTRLKQRIDANDQLFISKINAGERDGWLAQAIWDWIRARENR